MEFLRPTGGVLALVNRIEQFAGQRWCVRSTVGKDAPGRNRCQDQASTEGRP
jgi:hypothetical protein